MNYKLMCRSFALNICSDKIDDKKLASIQILTSNAYREDLNKKAANKALKNPKTNVNIIAGHEIILQSLCCINKYWVLKAFELEP